MAANVGRSPAENHGLQYMTVSALSACVITYNEADRIGACIEALRFCDEIVVVDSRSTDGTRELASGLGARVIERDWAGYRSQKQFATDAAAHDWVLCVDADERVTAGLRTEIERLRADGFRGARGWTVPRLNDYFGRFLRHGNSWPDRQIRLYDRRAAHWAGYEVHEKIEVSGEVGALQGPLEHLAHRHFDEYLSKMDRYAALMAAEMYRAGKRCGVGSVLFNPAWRLFRGLVVKGGLLDGWRGLMFHCVDAGYVRRKYLRLWALSRKLPFTSD
jgi:glycosyltransferase involved in cell wall biosynthesis